MTEKPFLLFISLILFIVSSCATMDTKDKSHILSRNPADIIESFKKIPQPGPPSLEEESTPVFLDDVSGKKLFSLHFEKAPLIEVLYAIVKDTGLNLSIEPGLDIQQPIYIRVNDITLKEALDAVVVKGADYSYRIKGGFLEIKRFTEKVYCLDYLSGVRKASTKVGGDILGGGEQETGMTADFKIDSKHSNETSDIWKRIEDSLNALKSTDGKILINPLAGIIYLIDTPSHVASMEQFLDQVKKSINRQVLIEAKILEVRLNDRSQYGIDWTALDDISHHGQLTFSQTLSQGLNSGGTAVLSGFNTGDFSLDILIDFLQTQGDVSLLSNPHISVLNGQSAILTIGHQYPYGDISGIDVQDETGNLVYDVDIKRAIVGVQLGITAHIAANGGIILHVVPSITDLEDVAQVEIPSVGNQVQSISNPIFDLRELGTVVKVHEGETVILAGLVKKTLRKIKQKIPLLGDIPGIGKLFQNFDNDWRNAELVILLTPRLKKSYLN